MNRMNRFTPPGVNLYEKDRTRKYLRLKKLRRLLGLPEKNKYISPGVYLFEND